MALDNSIGTLNRDVAFVPPGTRYPGRLVFGGLNTYLYRMENNSPNDADMTGDARRAEFFRTGLAAGFDAATLAIMDRTPASAAEVVGPQLFQALHDDEWSIVQDLLPDNVLTAPGGSPRMMLNAALHRARFPRQHWRSLPPAFAPVLDELRQSGVTSTTALADALNSRSIPTARGGRWHAASVARMIHRLA